MKLGPFQLLETGLAVFRLRKSKFALQQEVNFFLQKWVSYKNEFILLTWPDLDDFPATWASDSGFELGSDQPTAYTSWKGLAHEINKAFDDVNAWMDLGLNRRSPGLKIFITYSHHQKLLT